MKYLKEHIHNLDYKIDLNNDEDLKIFKKAIELSNEWGKDGGNAPNSN